ncbi:MAG: redoxin domain-containing protein [Syntrophaceae bacterium]|nr:redoxin domain-containing protein [Syntrophaceae bacterium]
MVERKVISLGKKAADFVLKDQNNNDVRLSDFQGRKVILSFHPLAWTPVCAEQMISLEKNNKAFAKLNAVAFGISVDSVPSKAAWAKSLKLKKTQLLADFWPHGKVAKSAGLLRAEGFSERANIILDEKGRVLFAKVYPIRQVPPVDELIAALKS